MQFFPVSFSSCGVISDLQEEKCSICWETFGRSVVVIHPGEGIKHPFHEKCIKAWISKQNCPFCRVFVDGFSLLSRAERSLIFLRKIFRINQRSFEVRVITSAAMSILSTTSLNFFLNENRLIPPIQTIIPMAILSTIAGTDASNHASPGREIAASIFYSFVVGGMQNEVYFNSFSWLPERLY